MRPVLILARGMYEEKSEVPGPSVPRLEAALAWAKTQPELVKFYTAAYRPPAWPSEKPTLAEVMEQYIKERWSGETESLTDRSDFTTRGELEKFLTAINESEVPAIVSSNFHLPRIFCYLWELRGWRYARAATYVPVYDQSSWLVWLLEIAKLLVVALPQPVQRRLEEWQARKNHTSY